MSKRNLALMLISVIQIPFWFLVYRAFGGWSYSKTSELEIICLLTPALIIAYCLMLMKNDDFKNN